MNPAVYEISEEHEATGIVYVFCTDSCQQAFLHQASLGFAPTSEWLALGESEIPDELSVCEVCGKKLYS